MKSGIYSISFRINPTMSQTILLEIFDGTPIENYFWINVTSQNEVWESIESGGSRLTEKFYRGSDFKSALALSHYIIFLKMQAYRSPVEYNNISTFDDFIDSNCELMILVYDCYNVEIYCKDYSVFSKIEKNIRLKNFDKISVFDYKSFGRTGLNIL